MRYDQVGAVSIGTADPFAESTKKLVFPEVCKVGGNVVTIASSAAYAAAPGGSTTFMIWHDREPVPAAAPKAASDDRI